MKKLRIGIDANEANVGSRVGTGQYTFNILKQWSEIADLDFHLYHRDELRADMPATRSGWEYQRVLPKRGWIRLGLPLHLLTHQRNDVFWSPAHYMPSYVGSNSVVTVHDLAYEFFPDLFLPSDLYKLKTWTRQAVQKSSHIIAVSTATKNDLINLYNVNPQKITVVHNGYDSEFFNLKVEPNHKLLSNYSLLPKSYILFLGTIQPRKNAIKLVQAFHLLKLAGYKGKLVIAGGIGWMADETLAVIKSSPESKDIVLTGYINDETRKALYANADVYVLPSLYEGFGVPAIEAMGCGAPVAVSDNSSLPEVVGEAGLYFNASDPEGMFDAIMSIKKDRASWVKKSLKRAQDFSWEKCAKETLKVITNVGEK